MQWFPFANRCFVTMKCTAQPPTPPCVDLGPWRRHLLLDAGIICCGGNSLQVSTEVKKLWAPRITEKVESVEVWMFESESSPTIATLFVTSPSRRTTSHSHGPLHLLYILWSLKYFTCTPGTLIALQLSYQSYHARSKSAIGSSRRAKIESRNRESLIQLIQRGYIIHYDKFYLTNVLKNILCVIIINLGFTRDKKSLLKILNS